MGMPILELDENGDHNSSNWRLSLSPECRQKIEKRIIDTLQMNMPPMGQECMVELLKISRRFEEKIFLSATDKEDYLRRIAFKVITLERMAHSKPNQ